MQVDETLYFELNNGKTIKVKDLDPKIQEHVKVLDRLRDDVANKGYELNVYQIALQAKHQAVLNVLEATYGDNDEADTKKTEKSGKKASK